MKQLILFIAFLSTIQIIECRIIDNRLDKYVDHNKNCDLPSKLKDEIKGYQPTVNRIVKEIVSGQFAGKTWER